MSPRAARRLRIGTGAVFVVAGLPKLVANGWELHAFRRFGLPVPQAWVIAAGIIEIAGGILLIADRHVTAAALLLAATMGVAVVASGVLQGDVIPSLTLAPALLIACLVLLRREHTI
ncbi:MAG: DoxX family protein [Solirubrobacteraceae bacterium]|nr:DoxX family protein [Solirubrobacteraceae bacterium]